MALALSLVLIVLATLAFHYASPWWLTPIASNWQKMDDALLITLVICSALFIAINLFVAYALLRFRHREGVRAARELGNHKLEWWLVGVTSVGIIAMLAPGLDVYAQLIAPPANAMQFEVMGQQWQWHYRLPGDDGKLGLTDPRFVDGSNPFGMQPDDPNGQDDRLVEGQEIHIPVARPVRVMLRAQDTLHDFYVPQFRTRMNMVPGMVTSFWFTPSHTGRFEVMCAQLCGVGHANMRSMVVVDEPPAYQAWLARQPTFATLMARHGTPGTAQETSQGRLLAQARGCVACHSVDGSAGVGPTWKGLYGKNEALADGSTVLADDAYLKQSISAPNARIVRGFAPVMPAQQFSDTELAALVDYIKSLGGHDGVRQ